MTVALLTVWGNQPPGTLYTSDATTEAAMIASKVAAANLAGAVAWVPNTGSSNVNKGRLIMSAATFAATPLATRLTWAYANVWDINGTFIGTVDGAGNLSAASSGNFNSDTGLSFLASGFTLPTVGTNAAAAITSGVAYINLFRVVYPGSVPGFANGDNYCDISDVGVLTVTTVTHLAAAPAVASNSIRIGYVYCTAGSVNSAVSGIKDSLGNWMGNRARNSACVLHAAPSLSIGNGVTRYSFNATNTTTEVYDNDSMHAIGLNPSRITAARAGLYYVSGGFQWSSGTIQELRLEKNGAIQLGMTEWFSSGNTTILSASLCGPVFLNAGDYIELRIDAAVGVLVFNAAFSAAKMS